jgi:ADP-ribosylglycohydrolase
VTALQEIMRKISDHHDRLRLALRSLEGLSVGDAFGDRFFTTPHTVERWIELRAIPAGPWPITDDTVMALSIVDVLSDRGFIDRGLLAAFFGARYRLDPARGYGGTAHGILNRIADGDPWAEVSSGVFGGSGSMGNGGAMRAAPIGAYFFDDFERAADNARQSAEVTHAHPEGQAGAIAAAIAAAWVARGGTNPANLFDVVLAHTPDSATRAGIEKAANLPAEYDVRTAASVLGNGSQVISQDTVPFSLWCAARHLGNYEEAIWTTVSGLGDRDTTCAIVGGIVALDPAAHIPPEWLASREPLERMSRTLLRDRFRKPG